MFCLKTGARRGVPKNIIVAVKVLRAGDSFKLTASKTKKKGTKYSTCGKDLSILKGMSLVVVHDDKNDQTLRKKINSAGSCAPVLITSQARLSKQEKAMDPYKRL